MDRAATEAPSVSRWAMPRTFQVTQPRIQHAVAQAQNDQLNYVTKGMTQMEERMTEMQTQMTTMKTELDEIKSGVSGIQNTVSSLEGAFSVQSRQIRNLEDKLGLSREESEQKAQIHLEELKKRRVQEKATRDLPTKKEENNTNLEKTFEYKTNAFRIAQEYAEQAVPALCFHNPDNFSIKTHVLQPCGCVMCSQCWNELVQERETKGDRPGDPMKCKCGQSITLWFTIPYDLSREYMAT